MERIRKTVADRARDDSCAPRAAQSGGEWQSPLLPQIVGVATSYEGSGESYGRGRGTPEGSGPELDFRWRRGWDSNPRGTCAPTRFPGVPVRPLQHLSGGRADGTKGGGFRLGGSTRAAAATLRLCVKIAPTTVVGRARRAATLRQHGRPGVANAKDDRPDDVHGRLGRVVWRGFHRVRGGLAIHFFFRRRRTKSGRLVTAPRAERTPLTTE
jgi:hypothetical protein